MSTMMRTANRIEATKTSDSHYESVTPTVSAARLHHDLTVIALLVGMLLAAITSACVTRATPRDSRSTPRCHVEEELDHLGIETLLPPLRPATWEARSVALVAASARLVDREAFGRRTMLRTQIEDARLRLSASEGKDHDGTEAPYDSTGIPVSKPLSPDEAMISSAQEQIAREESETRSRIARYLEHLFAIGYRQALELIAPKSFTFPFPGAEHDIIAWHAPDEERTLKQEFENRYPQPTTRSQFQEWSRQRDAYVVKRWSEIDDEVEKKSPVDIDSVRRHLAAIEAACEKEGQEETK